MIAPALSALAAALPLAAVPALPALLAPSAAACAQQPSEEDFTDGLERVHRDMERRRWDDAYDDLRELLEEHREQDYVYARRAQIREDMERIAFWNGRETPEPETLVAGTLEDYDEDDGDIEIVYTGEQMLEDWQWEQGQPVLTFPPRMTGKYEVRIEGRIYPTSSIWAIVGMDRSEYYRLDFGVEETGTGGRYIPGGLRRFNGSEEEELLDDTDTVPLHAGGAYEIGFEVSKSRITMEVDGDGYLKGRRRRGDFGTFALCGIPKEDLPYLEVTVEGEVETSWIDGLADAVMSEARAAFAEEYDEEEHLPEWFLYGDALALDEEGGGALREAAFVPNRRDYPGEELRAHGRLAFRQAMERMSELREDSGEEASFAHLDELDEAGELDPALRAWMRQLLCDSFGMLDEALEHARVVVEEDPTFLDGRLRLARLLDLAGRKEEAEREHLALLEDLPYESSAINGLLYFYLTNNRLEDAVAWANDYARDPRARDEIEDLQRFLSKADSGPVWSRTHEHSSEHYVVRSDLDEEICEDAARLLESAYTSYSIHLARVPGVEQNPFRVFIFSGESGYHDYADEAMTGRRENTLGLYWTVTKQLLIWNAPDREEMFRTVLHEGFHQYLDEVLPNPPVWFNEGMASYFEHCEVVNGSWTEGQVDERYLRLLSSDPPIPLRDYFQVSVADFYAANVGRNYAQGWALVHFLRNSEREHARLFDRLFEEMREQPSQRRALEAALEGVDLDELDRAFREHLASLRDAAR